jgi:cytochrome c-type biogenesis protein
VYGVAGVCASPILGSVLPVAAVGGNALDGGILLATCALGISVPLFVMALLWKRLMIISGVLSIGIGVLLLLTDSTASLGSILSIGDQFAAESWVLSTSSGISNLMFGLAAVAVLISVAGLYFLRIRRTEKPRQHLNEGNNT